MQCYMAERFDSKLRARMKSLQSVTGQRFYKYGGFSKGASPDLRFWKSLTNAADFDL